MHIYTSSLTVTASLASPPRCLSCGDVLEPVRVGDRVGFWCVACAVTWEPELGGMVATPRGEPPASGTDGAEGPAGPHT